MAMNTNVKAHISTLLIYTGCVLFGMFAWAHQGLALLLGFPGTVLIFFVLGMIRGAQKQP